LGSDYVSFTALHTSHFIAQLESTCETFYLFIEAL